MMPAVPHPTPRLAAVLREQVLAVGLVLRAPGLVAAALLALATVLVVHELADGGGPLNFHPEDWIIPGAVGLLLPFAVWRGEPRFGPGFLWTLPVDRRLHALTKVGAGWVWLMAGVAVQFLWLLTTALASGDALLAEETVRLLPEGLDPSAIQRVPWTPEPLFWLVPFTAASTTYVLGSAAVLGLRHPLRWAVGVVLAVLATLFVVRLTGATWLLQGVLHALDAFFNGTYGLDTLLTARTESLKTEVTAPTGEQVIVWRALPQLGHWVAATLLWGGAGLALLWVAASRHRERRRR